MPLKFHGGTTSCRWHRGHLLYLLSSPRLLTSMVLKRTLVLSSFSLSLEDYCCIVWWCGWDVAWVRWWCQLKVSPAWNVMCNTIWPLFREEIQSCFRLHIFFPYFFWVPYHVFQKQCQNKALVSFDWYIYIHHYPFSSTPHLEHPNDRFLAAVFTTAWNLSRPGAVDHINASPRLLSGISVCGWCSCCRLVCSPFTVVDGYWLKAWFMVSK